MLTSCDTPVGQGAAWGAATGAIIGGAATGNVRAASTGAAAGGHPGALTGKTIQENQAAQVPLTRLRPELVDQRSHFLCHLEQFRPRPVVVFGW